MTRPYEHGTGAVDPAHSGRPAIAQLHQCGVRAEVAGLKPGATFPLLPLTSLGRAPTNTITLNDTFASGEHALVTLRGGQWWLEDRGSSNGTLLNGYRIEEPVVISTGDVIGVGQVELKLELE